MEDYRSPGGRRFAYVIQALIVLSLLTFSLSTVQGLPARVQAWLDFAEVATVAIFTVEYLLRIYVADRRLGYILSFYGIVDLAAILPFYLASGLDLRAIRALRILRLFRILKLVRYNRAIRRFHRAFVLAREELVLYLAASSIVLYLAAVGIFYFEHEAQPEPFASVFHSLWWAVATLTTVGYGDIYPVTVGGKLFTFVVLMVGLGIIAIPAGLVASALSQARAEELRESGAGPGEMPQATDPEQDS